MPKRIVICSTRVPFSYGGAEMLAESLRDALAARGHEVDMVALPFAWADRVQLRKRGVAWRGVGGRAAARRPPLRLGGPCSAAEERRGLADARPDLGRRQADRPGDRHPLPVLSDPPSQ